MHFIGATCLLALTAAPAAQEHRWKAYCPPLDELLALADGHEVTFRFRKCEFEGSDQSSAPSLLDEGLLRLAYRRDGILLETLYVERDGLAPPFCKHSLTWFSVVSGESTRVGYMGDAGESRLVTIDYWRDLPRIAYHALGFLVSSRALGNQTPVSREPFGMGRERITLAAESASVQLDLDTDGEGALVSALFRKRADAPPQVTYFHDSVSWSTAAPRRPRLIVSGNFDPFGQVHESEIYIAVERHGSLCAEHECVPSQTEVIDLRGDPQLSERFETDRSLALEHLAAWVPVLGSERPVPVREYDFDFTAVVLEQTDVTSTSVRWPSIVAIAVALGLVIHWRRRPCAAQS